MKTNANRRVVTLTRIATAMLVASALSATASHAATFQYHHPIMGLVATPTTKAQQTAAEILVALTGGPALPVGEVNWPYSYDLKQLLSVTGDSNYNSSNVSWELQSGQLPAGLSLGSNGVISGTPTTKDAAGSSFQVLATYKTKTGQQAYTIVVNGAVLHVAQIAAGRNHTCVVTTTGGAKCWGENASGQLGDNTLTTRLTPVDVKTLTSGVSSISAGGAHTCAVTTSGGAKCWGSNSSMTLGEGTTTDSRTPVSVTGLTSGVASISAGLAQTCALTTAGGVKCWGWNAFGQLGNSSTASSAIPVNVTGLESGGALSVSASKYYYHACAVTTAGAAKCWGYNTYGQLGTGNTGNAYSPATVSGLTSGVSALALGYGHGCALLSDGSVKCWGYNTYGQVGDSTNTARYTPVAVVGLSNVLAITAGTMHSCAATMDGGVKCWGHNSSGQLGNNSTADRNVPVNVFALTSGVTSISAGGYHTCAITTSGGPKCWGRNLEGQLGNNSTTSSSVPVDVAP